MHKVFRNTTYVLMALMVLTVFAVTNSAADDASWSDNWIAYSIAIAPWMISGTVVFAAGEVLKAMRSGESAG